MKVYFTDPDSSESDGEHMWVELKESDGSQFKGILLSSPAWLKSVKGGDEVEFGTSDVTDWFYVEDGKAVGAYTVRLLRTRMSDEERAAHDAGYPFSFE